MAEPQVAPSSLFGAAAALRAPIALGLLLFSVSARADTLALLGPSGLVSPDGFEVSLVRRGGEGRVVALERASVRAEGGEVRSARAEGPLRVFSIVPARGSREVRLRGEDGALSAADRFAVGPPASQVQLTLEPAAPVKGKDVDARLTIRLRKPDGTPDADSSPPVLRANVGELAALERVAPGEFRARYLLPKTRYPEVAILVAFSAWPHPDSIHGAVARLLVPLATAIELPGRTEPNAQMSLEIAGNRYGPVSSDESGRFKIPVVVPPGQRFAQGLAVDRAGNRRKVKVDLMLPPTDQLACVMNPTRLPADGEARARVLCAASDPSGKPVPTAKLLLSTDRGTLTAPRPTEQGLVEWLYTAPKGTTGRSSLVASWKQGSPTSREELSLALVQGPVAKLELTTREGLVHRGGAAELDLRLLDAEGKPRPDVRPELHAASGTFSDLRERAPGVWSADYFAPLESAEAEVAIEASALGPVGSGPATLSVWREGEQVRVGVFDLAGWPVPKQPLTMGKQTVSTGEDGTVTLAAPTETTELQHAVWPGLRRTLHVVGDQVTPLGAARGAGRDRLTLTLGPPIPVNVRLSLEGRSLTYWVEDPRGRILPGRKVLVALSTGERIDAVSSGRKSQLALPAGATAVSVADAATGVTAVAEVRR